jgi:branched-chain amino acid transport system substrate-binding protein
MSLKTLRGLVGFALVLACLPAPAQIIIGRTAGITGPVAAGVNETGAGAQMYFDAVNAQGGINGQTIEMVSLDDKFDPKLAAANARKLIVDRKSVALFLTRGTPHTQSILPLLQEFKVPLVGPSTGAMVLHEPVHPWVFNVRATYQREAERAVLHLSTTGVTRIGVVQVDDSFGADMAIGARKGFAATGLNPVFIEKFDRRKPDYSTIAPLVARSSVQAVLFIGSGKAVVDGLKAIRAQGSSAQVITFSNNASSGFIESLGDQARGVIVTQVFPYERSVATGFVREAQDLAHAKGLPGVSPAMLEGFAAAKVLVAGLKRAGSPITREGLQRALNGIGKLDLGGIELGYSPTDHTGLDYVDLSIIGRRGVFLR